MRDDLRSAINAVLTNAHQMASREWENAAQTAAGPITNPGDPLTESRMTKGRFGVLDGKVRRIISDVNDAFKARRLVPDQADVDELCRSVDSALTADLAYILSRIRTVSSRYGGELQTLKNQTQEKGNEQRQRLMYEFNEMLVRLQNEQPADSFSSKTSSLVVHANYGQIGDHNQQQLDVKMQTFRDLIADLDKSGASKETKDEAKGILRRFFENPTVTSIAGSLAEGVVGILKPPGT